MVAAVLVFSGAFAALYGCVRGYAAARAALAPLVTAGEPTRTLLEATRPVHARTRVRAAVRGGLTAMLWVAVAMYGLYLATVGVQVAR